MLNVALINSPGRVLLSAALVLLTSFAARAADSKLFATEFVRARLADMGSAEKYDADAVVVFEHIQVNVRPNGIGETTTRRVTKILREGAIRENVVQRFDFDPSTNQLTIPAVRVYRTDGRVDEVPVEQAVEQPAPQWGIYWGSRQRLVEMPRLEIGDAVETVAIKVGFNVAYLAEGAPLVSGQATLNALGEELQPPMPGHWYDETTFASSIPVIEKRYTVRCPKDKPLQYAVYNGEVRSSVSFDEKDIVYSFEKRDIAPFRGEPSMVSAADVQCKLVLATLDDWKNKSRWFHQANEHAFEIDDEIRAMVRQLTDGLATTEERITALNHWVAENIRYVGTSRGSCEGYTTHRAIETFRDRGGVCKDKAGLLVAMLREAGFDSYIVMTMAGAEVVPVPADQFNHAVACIRERDEAFRLLDPTWMPKSRDNWSTFESLQHVVYGTPEGQELARSPYCPPEINSVTWKLASALSVEGSLYSEVQLHATGGPETNIRRSLAGRDPSERDRTIEEGLSRLGPATRLTNYSAVDPVDFSGPMIVQAQFQTAGFILGDRDRRMFQLPGLRGLLVDSCLGDVLGLRGPDARKFTAKARTTRKALIEERIELPAGWSVDALPEAVRIDHPAIALNFEVQKSADSINYRCELILKKHRVEPVDFPAVKQALDSFDKLANSWITLKTETVRAQR